MDDLDQSRATPLHPGVDPQSWLSFEQRIQARRFDALIASAREAIANGNIVFAEHAVAEAREIRPRDAALAAVDAQLRELRRADFGPTLWRRVGGGVMLLAAGVFMVVALDQARLMPESLTVITPPPPQFLGAVPTVRDMDVLATFADEVPDAVVVPNEDENREDEAMDATPAAPPARPTRPTRMAPATRAAEDAAPAAAPEVEPAVPIDVANSDFRPTLMPPPVVTASRPMLAPPVAPVPASVSIPSPDVDRGAEDQLRVADVLRRYARAYGNLDVSAAREIWPDVDQRALARAFDSLESQTVSFDDCQIDVNGATANASCRGQASYVGKVGRGAPRTEPRTWRFELRRDGETWKIASATARRTSG
jgi:hypothetical protein